MDIDIEQEANNTVVVGPMGYKTYIPSCVAERTPFQGQIFRTLDHGILFYKTYGILAGFDTRLTTTKKDRDNVVKLKYITCSKEGHRRQTIDTMDGGTEKTRKCLNTRTGCAAMISLNFVSTTVGYVVKRFIPGHNHPMVFKSQKHTLKVKRHVTENHVGWLDHCAKAGIGPAGAHRLMTQHCGGAENVGASELDFMNYHRDLKAYIGNSDVQVILDKFRSKKESDNGFRYDYSVDDEGRLTNLFWCDDIAVKNYHLYGDYVSFDTTYQTNKYMMPFCPFTGVDNYKNNVTFGLGLVTNEDIASFTWMFNAFLKAMDMKAPIYLVTDQDPAMKQAIPTTMPDTTHKLCMWHIMDKVDTKVPGAKVKDTPFYNSLYKIVFNDDIKPDEFEDQWNDIIAEYDLQENKWLQSIYEVRHKWIPAYYRDLDMGQFMRTSSRSESMNSAYSQFTNQYYSLVQFMWQCDGVIDKQRHEHYRQMMQSHTSFPQLVTNMDIERDAWRHYTRPVFNDIQDDLLDAQKLCEVDGMGGSGDYREYKVIDSKCKPAKNFIVIRTLDTDHLECNCNRVLTHGLLCSHIFCVLQNTTLKTIPQSLVKRRWCRETKISTIVDVVAEPPENPTVPTEALFLTLKKELDDKLKTPDVAEPSLRDLLDTLQNFKLKTIHDIVEEQRLSRTSYIASVTGIALPDLVAVKPPAITNTKGNWLPTSNRLKSKKEKAIEAGSKAPRLCNTCKQYVRDHDSRNCPLKKNKM